MAFDAGTIETTLTLDRSPFRTGLMEARKEAEAFEKRGVKLKVDVDRNFTSQLQQAISATQAKTGRGISLPVDIDESVVHDVQEKLERIGDNTETTARRVGNRMGRALTNPMIVSLGLIPAAAMAAGSIGALALGVLPLAMAGIGIAALKNSEEIKNAYSDVWDSIKTEAQEIAQPLEGVFVDISESIWGTWRQLRPELRAMFQDAGPLIQTFADGVLGAAEQAVPKFRTALQVSGPAMRGFASLIEDLGSGVGDLAVNVSDSSIEVGRSAELTGEFIRNLLGDVGTLIGQFSRFWSEVGPQFNATFDHLLDVVMSFTEGGLGGLSTGLSTTLDLVNALLSAIGPFAGFIGSVGGQLVAMTATWKIFAGAIGLAGKAFDLLRPSVWADKLSGVATAASNAGAAMGGYVTRTTGSVEAGERLERATSKAGRALQNIGGAIPFVGLALVGIGVAQQNAADATDRLANAFLRGGKAAQDASYEISVLNRQGDLLRGIPLIGDSIASKFTEIGDNASKSFQEQVKGMTNLERAQLRANQAQKEYDEAVETFGPASREAAAAQENLAGATDAVEEAQRGAAEATKSHTDRIVEQTNLMLGAVGARLNYQASLLQLEQSERTLADAVKEHGKGSLEARNADISYQQTLLSVVNSIGQRVMAENASMGQTKASELAASAMRQEIARLAVAAGDHLPPALAEMASKLTDAELKAMGVTREVNNTGDSIYRLPPGKSLDFPNNAPVATSQIYGLKAAVDALPIKKWFDYFITVHQQGAPVDPDFKNVPGLIGQRAYGGPVQANVPYWVGEKGIPELFFPNVDGFVLNGRDSVRLADSINRGGKVPAAPMGVRGGDGSDSFDYSAMAQAFAAVLDGATLVVDGDGLATLVNRTNLRNGAR